MVVALPGLIFVVNRRVNVIWSGKCIVVLLLGKSIGPRRFICRILLHLLSRTLFF